MIKLRSHQRTSALGQRNLGRHHDEWVEGRPYLGLGILVVGGSPPPTTWSGPPRRSPPVFRPSTLDLATGSRVNAKNHARITRISSGCVTGSSASVQSRRHEIALSLHVHTVAPLIGRSNAATINFQCAGTVPGCCGVKPRRHIGGEWIMASPASTAAVHGDSRPAKDRTTLASRRSFCWMVGSSIRLDGCMSK
jgi:hypothetical protein